MNYRIIVNNKCCFGGSGWVEMVLVCSMEREKRKGKCYICSMVDYYYCYDVWPNGMWKLESNKIVLICAVYVNNWMNRYLLFCHSRVFMWNTFLGIFNLLPKIGLFPGILQNLLPLTSYQRASFSTFFPFFVVRSFKSSLCREGKNVQFS